MPDLVSGYNIIRKLGDGARSTVYQVVEPDSGKTYTLKRVVRESHEDRRYLDQAIIGYEVAGRLNHPYLQKAFALKKIRRFFRLVEVHVLLEYVDGISLDKRPPERIDETVDLFLKVAEGLNAMHEANYLHTDIKPNNLLLPPTGGVKIIDFGQSCPIGFRKARIQGTPDYIAPEQAQRRPLSRQTDVFNLGATLYWALTGQTYPTIITKRGRRRDPAVLLRKPIPAPQDLNPEIPSALSRLVMESCADDPGRRPRDMKEVISRLEMVHHVLAKRKLAGHDLAAAARSPATPNGGPAAHPKTPSPRPTVTAEGGCATDDPPGGRPGGAGEPNRARKEAAGPQIGDAS